MKRIAVIELLDYVSLDSCSPDYKFSVLKSIHVAQESISIVLYGTNCDFFKGKVRHAISAIIKRCSPSDKFSVHGDCILPDTEHFEAVTKVVEDCQNTNRMDWLTSVPWRPYHSPYLNNLIEWLDRWKKGFWLMSNFCIFLIKSNKYFVQA